MRLTREIRCSPEQAGNMRPLNTWAGAEGANQLIPFWILRATVEGPVDPRTGYICDIKQLDTLLRERVLAELARSESHTADAGLGMAQIGIAMTWAFKAGATNCPLPAKLFAIEFAMSPFTRFAVVSKETDVVCLTRSFEFCASHRLAVAGCTDEENRRLFGKCSNPHGHGHNYVVEVTVRGAADGRMGTLVELPVLDRVVMESVIERFDHKNLNVECPEFVGVNPTVENIARVIFDRLVAALRPAKLASVRVWETAKTFAECDGAES